MGLCRRNRAIRPNKESLVPPRPLFEAIAIYVIVQF